MNERSFLNVYEDYNRDTFLLDDKNFEHFIENLIKEYVGEIVKKTNCENIRKKRGDLYVGLSGIAFMFLKLSKSDIRSAQNYLNHAKKYSDAALQLSTGSKPISLLSGDAGIYFTAATINKQSNQSYKNELKLIEDGLKHFQDPKYLDDGQDEMLVGRCGFLLGILWLNDQIQENILSQEQFEDMQKIILQSGREYSNYHKMKIPLMYQYHGREYLGAAHGISAILFTLLKLELSSKDLQDVKISIDTILQLQDERGNFPSKFNKPGEAHLVHWCHGAPGVIYLMAKAYLKFGDEKYLESCLKSGDLIWKFGLLKKGPGICHGIAGSGYAFLLLYRLTKDYKHLYRARKFAEFLKTENFKLEARTPDRPFSLFEGLSGTVCFLVDIRNPEKSEFPFMNVFD